MVNKVRVNIAGAPYAIATTDSEKYITSLAKKLDEDIAKLLDGNENLSVTKAAVFCAMDLSLIHISEPTRRTPISYAVFCLKKKKNYTPLSSRAANRTHG